MKRRTFIKGSGALIGAGALSPWTPVFADKANDTLRFTSERELESLDQYYNSAREGIILAHHIWDGLVYRDPQTFEYKPLLASAWKWTDDVTLDMDLRKGVKFHNGQPFTAEDVAYTLNFVVDPKNKVVVLKNVNWIKKAEPLDAHKVRIHLKQPFPPALDYLALAIPIYPHEYYASVGPEGMNRKPIGTGPYKAVKVESMSSVDMVANPDYFDGSPKGKPAIRTLQYRAIPDKSTQVAELMAGSVGWIWRVPRDRAQSLKQVPSVTVESGGSMRIGYVGFDAAGRSGKNPFMDRRVREAVALAINREAMVKNLVGGKSQVINAACYPAQVGCTEDVPSYPYDPDKARQLLKEAGYPNGFDTDFYAYRERPYAEAMIGYLRKVGINARLRWMTYSALRDKLRDGKVPFYFMTWASYSVNDVSAITSVFFELSEDDTARDKQVAEWLTAGDKETDPDKRKALYAKALKRIAEKVYWLPLFNYSIFYAFEKDLRFTPPADGLPRFFNASWK